MDHAGLLGSFEAEGPSNETCPSKCVDGSEVSTNGEFLFKTRNFVLMMMNFADASRESVFGAASEALVSHRLSALLFG